MRRRLWVVITIGLGVMLILTLFLAPIRSSTLQGSTYGRSPGDYGAWYQYMSERGIAIERWQKSPNALNNRHKVTLVQVYPYLIPDIPLSLISWVKKGNTLIVLGDKQPVTEAPFRTLHPQPTGEILIETKRRHQKALKPLLKDQFGAIAWAESMGEGKIISIATPMLAANAYQKFPNNYEFLAKLVTEQEKPILFDEYLHGYRDKEAIEEEIGGNLWAYWQKTPFFPLLIQLGAVLGVILWGNNHRFGLPLTVSPPRVNNSQAYIDALAGVLAKSENHQFMMETILEDEKVKLAQELGISLRTEEDISHLIDLWSEKTGQKPEALRSLLAFPQRKSHFTSSEVQQWLTLIRQLREGF